MKRLVFLLLAFLLSFGLVGCGAAPKKSTTETSGFPVTIKDATGTEVTIKEKPERIVSLAPSNTEILFALGLDDEIVGVTNYCDYPEAAKKKEKVGDLNTNTEKVVSLKPDLVVATASMNQQAIKALRDLGITVLAVDPQNVDQVLETIETIAKATGKVEEGKNLVEEMKNTLNEVKGKLKSVKEKVTVFVEVGYDPLYTAGKGSFVDDLVRLAGGVNIAKDLEFYQQYSLEELLAKNPQALILTDSYYLSEAQKVQNRQGWDKLDAVKNGRIIDQIDPNLLSRPGPRSAQAVKELAKALYPDLFK